MDDEAGDADRPLVVVCDQRCHRSEDVGDVDAIDRDDLGADELAVLGGDDKDAVLELMQRDGVRVLWHPMVVDWMDRCVAVPPGRAARLCASSATTSALRSFESSRVDLQGPAEQRITTNAAKWIGMVLLDRRDKQGGITVQVAHDRKLWRTARNYPRGEAVCTHARWPTMERAVEFSTRAYPATPQR